jgi:hypothetical protein
MGGVLFYGPANELSLSCKAAMHSDGDERHDACAELRWPSRRRAAVRSRYPSRPRGRRANKRRFDSSCE